MEVVYERCAGIDIHKKMVQVCCITADQRGRRHKEQRRFATKTQDLLDLSVWLKAQGCTHVAMESTGVYWKPVYNILEGEFAMLVVNAHHLKAVPARKTDVNDAEWIADLVQHGLLKASFIPSAPQRELRELTRYRVSRVEERTRTVKRLQKTLEDTNLKLGDVVSDVLGKAARSILEAVRAGESDAKRLAALAQGRVRTAPDELERARVGHVTVHHRFMLGEHLRHIDEVDASITRVTQEIGRRLCLPDPPSQGEQRTGEVSEATPQEGSEPDSALGQAPLDWQEAVTLLDSIPGINERAAQSILAEIGLDMTRFASAKHLASWTGVGPGNHESAGKRLSGKTRKGDAWLRRVLVQAAPGAAHSKQTYLAAQYWRLASRRGPKRAAMAVAHSILVIIYHVLRERTPYRELGGNFFDERDRQATEKRLVRRLEGLGYHVELQTEREAS